HRAHARTGAPLRRRRRRADELPTERVRDRHRPGATRARRHLDRAVGRHLHPGARDDGREMTTTTALPRPTTDDPDSLLDAFTAWAAEPGLSLYPHQEEVLIEILSGSNVILSTPTGSGKSLVATGAHFAARAGGRRTFYTAPIKALVSEKFFALCDLFG